MTYTHVLITRPQPEAGELQACLADLPLAPVVLPAYGFSELTPGQEIEEFQSSRGRKLVIFTSKRSVSYGLPAIPSALLKDATLAAIGPATAALLESNGAPVSLIPEGGFTSEDLLAAPELCEKPGAALVVTAPGGRTALARGLAALGWTVRVTHVYRRENLELPGREVERLLSARAVISAWTSENAIRGLAARLPEAAWQLICKGPAIVTSERLGRVMAEMGGTACRVAGGPGNEAISREVRKLV